MSRKQKHVHPVLSFIVIALCLGGAWVYYQQARDAAKNAWVCEEDAQTFCSHLTRGDGKVNRCLRDHFMKLTPACHTYINEVDPSAAAQWLGACASDAARLCSDMSGDPSVAGPCLESKIDQLSTSCRIYYKFK